MKFKSGRYLIVVEAYERYSVGDITPYIQRFSSLKELVTFLIDNFGVYASVEDLDNAESRLSTYKDILDAIESSNGDGADYIQIFLIEKNDKLKQFM